MSETNGPLKLVVVGEVGVGKTSLCGRLTDTFTKDKSPTIMPCFHKCPIKVDEKIVHFNIWDTAGAERYRSVNRSFYHNTKAAVLVYDITNSSSWKALEEYWVKEVREEGHDDMVIAIIGNKMDKNSERAVDQATVKEYCAENDIVFSETSAVKDINVKKVFQELAEQTLKKPTLFESKNAGKSSPSVKVQPGGASQQSSCAC